MATITANLPATGVASHPLPAAVANMVKRLFAGHAAAPAAVARKATGVRELSLWQLYRLTCGYDSISPKVAAELRRTLVGPAAEAAE